MLYLPPAKQEQSSMPRTARPVRTSAAGHTILYILNKHHIFSEVMNELEILLICLVI